MAYSSPLRQSRIYIIPMRYRAFVATLAITGVPEVCEFEVLEGFESVLGASLEHDDLGNLATT